MSASIQDPRSRINWDERYLQAVIDYGEGQTLELIEFFLGNSPHSEKIRRAELHGAFQILPRTSQLGIHRKHKPALKTFMRRLINVLLGRYRLAPIEKGMTRQEWQEAVDELREALGITGDETLAEEVIQTTSVTAGTNGEPKVGEGRKKPKKNGASRSARRRGQKVSSHR